MLSAVYGPDGVYHMACGQIVTTRNSGFTHWAAAEGAALGEEFWPRRAMNGPIDSTATQERGVGRVDDGIDVQGRDVGGGNLERDRHPAEILPPPGRENIGYI